MFCIYFMSLLYDKSDSAGGGGCEGSLSPRQRARDHAAQRSSHDAGQSQAIRRRRASNRRKGVAL